VFNEKEKNKNDGTLEENKERFAEYVALMKQLDDKNKISDYKVIRYITSGNQSTIFKCEVAIKEKNVIKQKQVAMKLMFHDNLSTHSMKDAIGIEYNILSQLPAHQNIVRLLKHFVDEPNEDLLSYLPGEIRELMIDFDHISKERSVRKTMAFILEYYEKTLEEYLISTTDLNMEKLISICRGIGRGLQFLFDHKVIHRDMKLENIMMDENDCPIICDFGMAIFVDDEGKGEVKDIGGNFIHLAPEVHNLFSE